MGVGEREVAQELAERGAEPSPKYFQKDEEMVGVPEGSLREMDNVPQIDISLLTSPSPATAAAEARKLGSALSTYGFCLVTNHGMTSEFLDGVRGVVDEFFQLPPEEKCKLKPKSAVGPAGEDTFEGYGVDETPEGNGSQEWCDRLFITVIPESQRKLQFWPDRNPSNFREIIKECSSKVEKLLESVLKGMARSLGLEEEDSLVEEIGGNGRIVARFNLYPKCSRPDRVLGVNSHTDGSVVTFLLQDKHVEGLQVLLKDGEWVRVPVTPTDALVLNVGDQGEIISNGEFKAPLHRATVSRERARKSLALFCVPEIDKTIGPAKGLVGETRPAKFNKVANYEREYLQQANHRALIESLKLI